MVSIITINYNSLEVTCELLESIRKVGYKNVEVIVVDNASNENPEGYLSKYYPEIIFIRSEKNFGFAGGNNLGISASRGSFLFFLNNDAELSDGAIEKLLNLFSQNSRIGIASPKICYHNARPGSEPDVIQYAGTTHVHPLTARNSTLGERQIDNGQYQTAQPTAYAHGAAMMVPREVVEKVGGMPEEFFLYYEELDWCEQIRRAGYEIWVEPNAKIYHKESYSVSKISALKTYYLNRNRLLFMRRNRSRREWRMFCVFLFLFTVPKNSLLYLLKGEQANLKAFWKAIRWNFSDEKIRPDSTPLTFKQFRVASSVF
ncbi:MAG: glycosyltransferase family 2 protein [Bacteroidetes bacterium]|nr:glycosyltransferase family 2 protein [Bacteroidota bacterium]